MMRVVVVEDEELVRKGIVQATDWQGMGCEVVGQAANGVQGCEMIRALRPDLVVTDIKMPLMDGVEMIATLRKEGQVVEFIILSAYSEFHYAQKALKLGVADYLLKPFEDSDLAAAVSGLRLRITPAANPMGQAEAMLEMQNLTAEPKSKYMQHAHNYIAQHYAEPAICVRDVAESLLLSEGYVSRLFKKEEGQTFNTYLTHYRINCAMQLLHDPRAKIYEVSEQVGYLDPTYFSTVFKRLVGCTPSEYQAHC